MKTQSVNVTQPGCAADWPHVAIILLTWNQRQVTLECLDSLDKMEYAPDRLEVIVADNGSTDGTCEAIRTGYPRVVLIENGENLGFAAGNNAGIEYALRTSAQYIMLLNNDTVVVPDMLTRLIEIAEHDPGIGIVGPKMLYYDTPDIIWCAGNQINWRNGDTRRLQANEHDHDEHDKPHEVDFITGCAICVRRQVIDQIGRLDPRFFIYYEETDWCVRAHAAGWGILYVPRARLYHKVSMTMGATSPATEYYMNRNVLLFLAKNRSGLAAFWSVFLACMRNLLTVSAYTVKSHHGQRLLRRNARLLALRDALLGRWGKMGPDVALVCYPQKT
jgi:GT2 family glycosyltransferase